MYAQLVTLAVAAIAIVFTGCIPTGGASTFGPNSITSFVDPAFRGHIFQQVAVIADTSNLEWLLKLEQQLARTFRARGVNGVEGSTIIPPTRQWSEPVRRDTLAANGITAYLVLEVIESGEWTKEVPATSSTTVSRERKPKKKQTRSYGDTNTDTADDEEEIVTTTTTQEGGYTERTPWTRYRVRLIDVSTGEVAWIGMNVISGNPGNRLGSFCQEIVAQLQRDGLVAALVMHDSAN